MVLAPQRQQAQDLEEAGMPAQTLAHALVTNQFEPGGVVILDEAGQVGVRDMHALIEALRPIRGRLILSGDTRQHGAVAAGDALRYIESRIARKSCAELRAIRRQNPNLARSIEERRYVRAYRQAVATAAAGNIEDSFDRLDALGSIRELPDEARRTAVAGEYLAALDRADSPLVVAQTWDEVHAVNDAIRAVLRTDGRIGSGTTLTTFQPLDRSSAQRRDARFYETGQAIFFIRRYGRHRKGDVCEVVGAGERGVSIVRDGRRSTVSFRYGDRWAVVRRVEMEIAAGDRLQLKANGRSAEGVRFHNGDLVTVARVDPTGTLAVVDERGATKTLGPSQLLLVRGYAVTSYGSQGKTADTVIVADAGSRPATNRLQWYVSISRGRKRVVVFTPDKTALRQSIQQTGTRELASENHSATNVAEREFQSRQIRRARLRRYAIQEEFARQQAIQQNLHHGI